MFMLKITYKPDKDVMFYYAGQEEVGIEYAIKANSSLGEYGTDEENAELYDPDNYVVEELTSRELFSEIEMLVNNKNFNAEYNGAILTVSNY